jgi:DNA-binding transcriptional regulator YhcF (GntR family)
MDWNLDSSRPIWPQLEEQLKRMIVAGQFPPGEQFPTVRELAEDAKVNPNTMQRALSQLEHEGLLVTMRTSGRRVTEDGGHIESLRKQIAEEKVESFCNEIGAMGFSTEEIIEIMRKKEGDRQRGGEHK